MEVPPSFFFGLAYVDGGQARRYNLQESAHLTRRDMVVATVPVRHAANFPSDGRRASRTTRTRRRENTLLISLAATARTSTYHAALRQRQRPPAVHGCHPFCAARLGADPRAVVTAGRARRRLPRRRGERAGGAAAPTRGGVAHLCLPRWRPGGRAQSQHRHPADGAQARGPSTEAQKDGVEGKAQAQGQVARQPAPAALATAVAAVAATFATAAFAVALAAATA